MNIFQKIYPLKENNYLTHSLNSYPQRSVPQIFRELIKKYSQVNETVLDPFVGSGTSLLESNYLKRDAIGLDVNPFACLSAKVKTNAFDINELKSVKEKLVKDSFFNLKRDGTLKDFTERIFPEIPDFLNNDFWFSANSLTALAVLRHLIKKTENKQIQDFFWVAFSSILQEVSNATSCYKLTRAKNAKRLPLLKIAYKFKEKVDEMALLLENYDYCKNSNPIYVFQQDSRLINLENIDLVIMNVPKFNTDFMRCFKIYYWWLNLGNINDVNENFIGALKGKKLKAISFNDDFSNNAKLNETMHKELGNYYNSIKKVLEKCFLALREKKYCCVEVADTTFKNQYLMHGEAIKKISQHIGFTLEEKIPRIIPKKFIPFSTKGIKESFLILRKK
jgi:hypothetical protein